MLQKFKITSYAIMVALAAVLVLPVNAAELQLVSPTGIQVAQKKKGMTDKMFKELIAVVAMANETNRLVESYQVKVDNFLK